MRLPIKKICVCLAAAVAGLLFVRVVEGPHGLRARLTHYLAERAELQRQEVRNHTCRVLPADYVTNVRESMGVTDIVLHLWHEQVHYSFLDVCSRREGQCDTDDGVKSLISREGETHATRILNSYHELPKALYPESLKKIFSERIRYQLSSVLTGDIRKCEQPSIRTIENETNDDLFKNDPGVLVVNVTVFIFGKERGVDPPVATLVIEFQRPGLPAMPKRIHENPEMISFTVDRDDSEIMDQIDKFATEAFSRKSQFISKYAYDSLPFNYKK